MPKKSELNTDGILALQQELIKKFNKDSKRTVAYDLSGDDENPSAIVTDYVSTGCWLLDHAISNKPDVGGLPLGRIIDISGEFSTGKSLLTGTLIREVQAAGGIGIIADTEQSTDKQFLHEVLGIDLSKMVLLQTKETETIFDCLHSSASMFRQNNKNIPLVFVIDSMPGMMSRNMMSLDNDDDFNAVMLHEAKKLGVLLNRSTEIIAEQKISLVCIGQARDNIGGLGWGPKKRSTSGNQLKHFSTVAVWLQRIGNIKKGKDGDIIGVWIEAQTKKNHIAPPFKKVWFPIFFNRGIDNSLAELKYMEEHDLIKKSKQNISMITVDGEEKTTTTRDWMVFYEENKTDIRNIILNRLVTKNVVESSEEESDSSDGSEEE